MTWSRDRLEFYDPPEPPPLSRARLWLPVLFALFYFPGTALIAAGRPMWNDELFTYYLSNLSQHDLWQALQTGGESLPPFYYAVIHLSTTLFDRSELALRAPSIWGVWLMSVCLFLMVTRRTDVAHGVIAMLLPLVSGTYRYAYEARPYGLMLGLSALALLCWQASAENEDRRLSLIVLGCSLAGAVGCHYYAVFLVLPLCIGELARSWETRRFDAAIWAAFIGGLSPLVLWWPLVQGAKENAGVFWARPTWGFSGSFYETMLAPAVPAAVLALGALLVTIGIRKKVDPDSAQAKPPAIPGYEVAAYLGFIALPVVATIAAELYLGGLSTRYLLVTVVGLFVLVPLLIHRLMGGSRFAATGVAVSLALCALGIQGEVVRASGTMAAYLAKMDRRLRDNNPRGLPVVLIHGDDFMQLMYYASDGVKQRLVYLADPDLSLRFLGHNTVDRSMTLLHRWWPGDVQTYQAFMDSNARFLVAGSMGDDGVREWVLSKLVEDSVRLELKLRDGDELLFQASHDMKKVARR